MSKAVKTRQEWRCPSCGRKYRIPVKAKAPSKCPDCAEEEKTIVGQESGVVKKELSLSNAPEQPAVVTTTFFEPEESEEETERTKEKQKKSWKKKAKSNPLVAALLEEDNDEDDATSQVSRDEIDDILKYLKNISKTMTIVRRMLGMFIIMAILSLLSMIFFTLKFKDMFQGGIGNQLMQQVQPLNVNAQPNADPNMNANVNADPNARPNPNQGGNLIPMEKLNEYNRVLNELLNERK